MPATKITYDSGDVYEGHWNGDGRRHGTGKLTFKDGIVYKGKFQEGFFSGLGVLCFPNGSKYEGYFENGKYSGLGVFTNKEGMKYEGEFKVSAAIFQLLSSCHAFLMCSEALPSVRHGFALCAVLHSTGRSVRTTVHLYHSTLVPQYTCTTVHLYHSAPVPQCTCTTVHLYHGALA